MHYLKLYLNEMTKREFILKELSDLGYLHCPKVQREGDYSCHGEIIDIYPLTYENPLRLEVGMERIESIRSYDLISGETLDRHQMAIVLPRVGSLQKKNIRYSLGEDLPIDNFIDLEAGNYVVHVKYGIGRYLGIEKLKSDTGWAEHLVIEYAGSDKLYVPLKDIHLVQKYLAFERKPPKLYKLGTKIWAKIKRETKSAVVNLAKDLLQVQAARLTLTGYAFSQDTPWQKELEESFTFPDTADQKNATLEVKKDMEQPHPMDRLLCGDVGYGKTEVALRAAFKAVMDNKQVAVLVPTTILAEQHYYTFTQRLKEYPVNVQMLSRFKSKPEQARIVQDLNAGRVDLIIGTHRLLQPDIKFKDLGLVIIDEEQRFGVKDKEKLKALRMLVDVLTLTATPIPRTLYFSLVGAKDISMINTPPAGRIPVETKVLTYDEEIIQKALNFELERRGQAYYVHNQVKDIEHIFAKLRRLAPKARVGLAHGQMSSKELEEVMLKFIKAEIDILVSTNIIESGIDIPNANTLIVERADLFGLADLYQLRGRVGRFTRKAHAYFLYPRKFVLPDDAQRRLAAIEKHQDLGSGFKIAMEDLQIRGSGNILGKQQHGFISAVGFDLYCRLLKEAISDFLKEKKQNPKKG